MANAPTELNDNTRFAMPVRNLISLVVAVALGVWAYFGPIKSMKGSPDLLFNLGYFQVKIGFRGASHQIGQKHGKNAKW